jgi:hypothetical protein
MAALDAAAAEELLMTLERIRTQRVNQQLECHGWAISFVMRAASKSRGKPHGDFQIIDPTDGSKLYSILSVKRKLGLHVDEMPQSAPHTKTDLDAERLRNEQHERDLEDNMAAGDGCFVQHEGEWYRATLLGTRTRAPRFYAEIVSTAFGNKTHARALPAQRRSHVHATCVRRLTDPPPPPPAPDATEVGRKRKPAASKTPPRQRTETSATVHGGGSTTTRCPACLGHHRRHTCRKGTGVAPIVAAAPWLVHATTHKETRVGRSHQAELPLYTVPSIRPPPAAPPRCFCGHAAMWRFQRWWCADDEGCAFEQIPPPCRRTPVCRCDWAAVWHGRTGTWHCARTGAGGCAFKVRADDARDEPQEPTLQAHRDLAREHAIGVGASLTAYAYQGTDAPIWSALSGAPAMLDDGDGDGNDADERCEVCSSGDDGDLMLMCDSDGCGRAYHTYCITPPLAHVPEGDWFCPTCVSCRANSRRLPPARPTCMPACLLTP